jgi:glycosyltransferase involved in cell wall biosynthesis
MPRLLIVTTNFWPEPAGIAVYTTDLAEALAENGYEIEVLTSLPHYPWWSVPEEFAYLVEGTTKHNSLEVTRVKHFIPRRVNVLSRIRFEVSLWWNLYLALRRKLFRNYDVVIACIPTVAAGIVGNSYAKRSQVPFGLIIQDLSGVGAKQSGLRGGALISRVALAIEGAVFKAADSIVVVSQAMRAAVTELGVPSWRIFEISNYSARRIESVDRDIARRNLGWKSDDFIVVHTGNLGTKQEMENVVEASKALSIDSKVKIYLVGHGNQEAYLKNLCDGLKNISIIGAVPGDQYSALLSAADVLLVNERSSQMEMSLPSKLTSYLFSNRAVLAAVPRGGATWNFLEGIAELVEAGKPLLLANAIKDLSQNPEKRNELASKGLEFARKNLGLEMGRKKYLDWVKSLIQSKRG